MCLYVLHKMCFLQIDTYNNLEKQLISALQAAQHQQKQLLIREAEVRKPKYQF